MINYDRQINIKYTQLKLEEANQKKMVYLKKNATKVNNYKTVKTNTHT